MAQAPRVYSGMAQLGHVVALPGRPKTGCLQRPGKMRLPNPPRALMVPPTPGPPLQIKCDSHIMMGRQGTAVGMEADTDEGMTSHAHGGLREEC